jgi:tetratricopeptide (TPR) repeat protein
MGRAQRRKQERAADPRPAQPARPPARGARSPAGSGLAGALLAPLLLAVVVLVLYANSFSVPFLFDDYFEISRNPMVKAIEPPLDYLTRARGIPAFTIALNYRLGGFDLWGFHLVNVLVHLANGLLVYALVLRTLRLPGLRERYGHVAEALAALVALVFVAHPLQVMAVSYIVQRAESIAAFFYLATLLLFSLAWTAATRGRRLALYGAAVLSALLGVVSKEIVVTVPLAALAYRLCFLPRGEGGARAGRIVFGVLLLLPLAYGLVLAWPYLFPAHESVAPDAPRAWLYIPTAGFRLEGITVWQYLLTQFGVILWYLRLFVLPTHQTFDYGWPFADSLWRADVLLPLIVLLGLVAVAVRAYRRYALASFCLAWLFITLAPTSSIIPLGDAAFEHRMYLPIVGLAWLVVVGGYDLLGWVAARAGGNVAALRRAGAVACAVWIVLLGAATMVRNGVMQDRLTLAADTIAKAPDNWRGHANHAEALIDAGRNDEAMRALEAALRLDPKVGSARVQLGQLYLRAGRLDDAEAVLKPATEELEESVAAAAYMQLAMVYERRGETPKTVEMLSAAVRRKPGWSQAQAQLGAAYARAGFWYDAAGHYNTALRLNDRLLPRLAHAAADANLRAAANQLAQEQPDAAENLLTQALVYRPTDLTARHYLALVHAQRGEWERALGQLEALRQSLPADPVLRDNIERARRQEALVAPPLPVAPRG